MGCGELDNGALGPWLVLPLADTLCDLGQSYPPLSLSFSYYILEKWW